MRFLEGSDIGRFITELAVKGDESNFKDKSRPTVILLTFFSAHVFQLK